MSNPWLSMWLSAANSWAGPVRGFWTAEMQRQQTAMMNEITRQATQFWMAPWAGTPLGNPEIARQMVQFWMSPWTAAPFGSRAKERR